MNLLGRQFPALVGAVLQAEFDSLADILQGFVAGAPLTDAARNHGAFGYEVAVLPRSQNDR